MYTRVPQIFPWRSNLLQSLAPTWSNLPTCDFLMILKTLISMLRCVWLGFELNSAGLVKIWGPLIYTINEWCIILRSFIKQLTWIKVINWQQVKLVFHINIFFIEQKQEVTHGRILSWAISLFILIFCSVLSFGLFMNMIAPCIGQVHQNHGCKQRCRL